MNLKVSIIIPAYNRAKVLPRAINSVLTQTYQDFEIIIVDDCSRDNTDKIIKQFTDPRIRYIKHKHNKGGNAARNTGIKEARGEFIAFLDSDDEWLSDKLNKQMKLFAENGPSVGLIYAGQRCYDENNGKDFDYIGDKTGSVFSDMLVHNYIGSLSVVIVRAEYIHKVGGLDEQLKSCQDWDFYIRLSRVCQFDLVKECLIKYHVGKKDPNRISNNRLSIVAGHEAIQRKYATEIEQLSKEYKLRHIKLMREVYAASGDLNKVLAMTCTNGLKNLDFWVATPRIFVRCLKRNILKDYGY